MTILTESIVPPFRIGIISVPLPGPNNFKSGGELYSLPAFCTITSVNLPSTLITGINWAFLPLLGVNVGCLL